MDRIKPFLQGDDLPQEQGGIEQANRGLQTETTFTNLDQDVQKSELDLFGTILKNQKINVDLYFIEPLEKFNLPMIKYSWLNQDYDDILKLPVPESLQNMRSETDLSKKQENNDC